MQVTARTGMAKKYVNELVRHYEAQEVVFAGWLAARAI
jgi:hypothetical protein